MTEYEVLAKDLTPYGKRLAPYAAVKIYLASDVATMQEEHRREVAAKGKEIATLKRFQSVCHCGALSKDHGYQDGHCDVPMEELCPYAERLKRAEDALRGIKVNWKVTALALRDMAQAYFEAEGKEKL
jgi:hypothetical protein